MDVNVIPYQIRTSVIFLYFMFQRTLSKNGLNDGQNSDRTI
jgi:hypothetical protein